MTKFKQNITLYFWIIPILILSGVIVYFDSSLNACFGLSHLLRDLFILLILILILIVFLIGQTYKIIKLVENRKAQIFLSVFVFLLVSIVVLEKLNGSKYD